MYNYFINQQTSNKKGYISFFHFFASPPSRRNLIRFYGTGLTPPLFGASSVSPFYSETGRIATRIFLYDDDKRVSLTSLLAKMHYSCADAQVFSLSSEIYSLDF